MAERGLIHGPHVHGDGPVGFDDLFPNARKDDLAIRTDQIVVAFLNVRADNVDMEEGLFDQFFHTLRTVSESD